MEDLLAKAWKKKVILRVELESPTVTITSPLKGIVHMDVNETIELPSGLELVATGEFETTTVVSEVRRASDRRTTSRSQSSVGIDFRDGSAHLTHSGRYYDQRNKRFKKQFFTSSITVLQNGMVQENTSCKIPFEFSIPADKLPAPFVHATPETIFCCISYSVHALIKTGTFSFNLTSQKEAFTPIAPAVDIGKYPPLESSRSTGFLFGSSGETATVTIRSPRSTFTSGDDVGYFLLFGRNDSARNMNELQFRLVQRVTVQGSVYQRVILKQVFPGVSPSEAGHKVIRVEIPQCAPTTTGLGDSLQVTYEAEVVAVMGMSVSSLVASAPVVITQQGRGIMFPERIEKEEADLEESIAKAQGSLTKMRKNAEGALEAGEGPPIGAVDAVVGASSGSTLSQSGARQIKVDQPLTGTVSFQSSNLYFFDLIADLAMTNMEDQPEEEQSNKNDVVGMPTVIVEAESNIGIRISKDVVPTWFSYQMREEARSDAMDGTQELLARLNLGPGRYFIAVFGNSLYLASGVRYRISLTTASRRSVLPDAPSEGDEGRFRTAAISKATLPYWITSRNGEIPADALVAGKDIDGTVLFVARAVQDGGLHVGKIGRGFRTAFIPFGGVEKPAGEYEVLCAIPGARWEKLTGRRAAYPPNAIPAGYEKDGRPLYIGRATINAGWKSSLCIGKAAPHLNGVNLPFAGKENTISSEYEVLVYDEPVDYTLPPPPALIDELEDYHLVRSPTAWKEK
ncbi:hypothetical protein HDU97_000283 [Phlyctochytrium planicorne]|nr:hypothetical protein HDU97_000283 [Phlyctochytrium planicorne]